MKNYPVKAVAFFVCFICITGHLSAYKKSAVMLKMSDGTQLNTVIFAPDDTTIFPLPALLVRTPYGADLDDDIDQKMLISILTDFSGYIVVGQDLRGTGQSEGDFRFFQDDGWGSNKDGYETIEWIAAQKWSDKKIGMIGASAQAIVQYLAAGAETPHLVCGIPIVGSWNLYSDAVYPGGEFRMYDITNYTYLFDSRDSMLKMIKENYNYNSFWNYVNSSTKVDKMKTPMLHIGGWYDFFAPGQINAFYDMQYKSAAGALGNQKLIIGPWAHNTIGSNETGQIEFPQNASLNYSLYILQFSNYWLKNIHDPAIDTMHAVNLYLMGPDDTTGYWNNWLRYDEWPFTDTDTLKFNFATSGRLTQEVPEAFTLSYKYNPDTPMPTIGGNNMTFAYGPADQSSAYQRPDVLIFQTDTYDKPFDIFGNIRLKLKASSDRFDTDFSAVLVDIYPDGRKMLITSGILMARHRNSMASEDFLTPNEVYEFDIDLNYTAYTIVPGHKLGLIISSANSPKFAPNPNTNEPVNNSVTKFVAYNIVYFGGDDGTVLVAPIRKNGFVSVPETSVSIGQPVADIISNNNTLTIYTNSPAGEEYRFRLLSLLGNLIESGKVVSDSKGSINLEFTYNSGVYFLELVNPDKTVLYKVLHY